jgi:hypothetical protein
MQVKIVGIWEGPVPDEPESEVVVFEGSCKAGRMMIETNRYHRLEVVLTAEPEGELLEAEPILCGVCQAEVNEVDVVCSDCEGARRGD